MKLILLRRFLSVNFEPTCVWLALVLIGPPHYIRRWGNAIAFAPYTSSLYTMLATVSNNAYAFAHNHVKMIT